MFDQQTEATAPRTKADIARENGAKSRGPVTRSSSGGDVKRGVVCGKGRKDSKGKETVEDRRSSSVILSFR